MDIMYGPLQSQHANTAKPFANVQPTHTEFKLEVPSMTIPKTVTIPIHLRLPPFPLKSKLTS